MALADDYPQLILDIRTHFLDQMDNRINLPEGLTSQQEEEIKAGWEVLGWSLGTAIVERIMLYIVANLEVNGVVVDTGTGIQSNSGTGRVN